MIINRISLLFLLFSSLQVVASDLESNNKLTNKLNKKLTTINEILSSKKTKSKQFSFKSADLSKAEQAAHQVCAIDDNGQDWAKLQNVLKKQLKKVTLAKKQKSAKFRSQVNNQFEDNGIAGRYYIPVVFHIYGEEFNCDDAS